MRTATILACAVLMTAAARGAATPGQVMVSGASPGDSSSSPLRGTVTLRDDATSVQPAAAEKVNNQKQFEYLVAGDRQALADAAPALVVTQPLDPKAAAEWKEDMQVMAKLVQDALAGPGQETTVMMGIMVPTQRNTMQPMYVEGCGVVISGSVSWPLIGEATKGEGATANAATESAWDRAKSEVEGKSTRSAQIQLQIQGWNTPGTVTGQIIQPFDAARLDALKKKVVAALAEGSHFRHLGADESVIVTISGTKEGGGAARLTMKAKKSDMDALAAGNLPMDAFAAKVATLVE